MVGRTISHYRVLEKLGGGGMGIVYKAQDLKLGRTVALKFLPPTLGCDEEAKQRFVHEAQAASALDHPNICDIHDIGQSEDGQLFIVMTSYEGEPLNARIARGPLRIPEALDITAQVAHGLSEAHKAGIVHRDVKPSNIFITKNDVAKILDFGLAKLSVRTAITRTGSSMGTAAYMSPEQARGEQVDHRTDIWSLGVVLYEMISGKLPFLAEYQNALMYAIQSAEPEPLTAVRTGVPMELERIVRKCLMKEPGERYQHADELVVDLKALKVVSSSGQKPAPPTGMTAPNKRRTLSYILAAAGLIAVAVLALWWYNKTPLHKETAAETRSIAVLPPRNLSKLPGDELLSEGILEGLITELGKIKSLSTIGRQSVMRFSGTDKSYSEIATELGGVGAIVEPTFMHVGNKLQLHARLIEPSDGKVLWAGVFDKTMDNILVIQSELAQTVAREIRATVTAPEQKRLANARPVDPDLYRLYLRGRSHIARRTLADFRKSTELFMQVLEKDPGNALAYAGLSESYAILPFYEGGQPSDVFPKAKAAALKALELDNSLAEAHTALAFVLFYGDWDFQAAEKELLEAIDLKPSYVVAHHWYAEYLSAMGRHEQALAEVKRAQELDPLSPLMLVIGGEICYLARRYDEIIPQCLKALELDSTYILAYGHLCNAYIGKKMYAEAAKAARLRGPDTTRSYRLAIVYSQMGLKEKARSMLTAWQHSIQEETQYTSLAIVSAGLGDRKQALDWLEKAFDERDPDLVFLNVSPRWDPLRSEPRFKEMVRRVGLPEK
jgi:eukaryotic-like serine/threonine-protein kinase